MRSAPAGPKPLTETLQYHDEKRQHVGVGRPRRTEIRKNAGHTLDVLDDTIPCKCFGESLGESIVYSQREKPLPGSQRRDLCNLRRPPEEHSRITDRSVVTVRFWLSAEIKDKRSSVLIK